MGTRIAVIALGGLLFLSAAPALADNDVGCGIGTNLMEGKSGLVAHVLASFTNGSTGNVVSLTSNLSGCDSTGAVTADAQLRKFAAGNIDQLSRDFARGEGEALSAFAHLLDVPEDQHAAFGSFVQANFVQIFPHAGVDSNEMIDAFDRLLQG